MMNCGYMATIIAYRGRKDIDVKFEDGTIREHREYRSFTAGEISNKIKSNKARDMGTYQHHLQKRRKKPKEIVKDHKGNEYESITEMCREYGISQQVYSHRTKKLGWAMEKALETPVRRKGRIRKEEPMVDKRKKAVTDHLGNSFPSYVEMARAYNIPELTLFNRLTRGWDIKRALTQPIKGSTKDFKGKVFQNYYEMAKHHNSEVPYQTYKMRLNNGWNKKDALLKPLQERHYISHEEAAEFIKAHNDIKREDIAKMLNISETTMWNIIAKYNLQKKRA